LPWRGGSASAIGLTVTETPYQQFGPPRFRSRLRWYREVTRTASPADSSRFGTVVPWRDILRNASVPRQRGQPPLFVKDMPAATRSSERRRWPPSDRAGGTHRRGAGHRRVSAAEAFELACANAGQIVGREPGPLRHDWIWSRAKAPAEFDLLGAQPGQKRALSAAEPHGLRPGLWAGTFIRGGRRSARDAKKMADVEKPSEPGPVLTPSSIAEGGPSARHEGPTMDSRHLAMV